MSKNPKKKRSICFAVTHPKHEIGGSEIQSYIIGKELSQRGWKVDFVSPTNDSRFPKREMSEGIEIWKVKINLTGIFNNIKEILHILKTINADLYYCRSRPFLSIVTAYGAKSEGKSLVWHCALKGELYQLGNTRNYFSIQEHSISKIIDLPKAIKEAMKAIAKDFSINYTRNNADLIIAQDEYQKRLLEKNFKIESSVIRNCHPTPNGKVVKCNPPMILWLSGISPIKQLEHFIKIAEKCEELGAEFIIAGRIKNKDYFNQFRSKINYLKNLTYYGPVTYDESNELIGKASLFINTSYDEGFPNTFIQAWHRKTPVVSLNFDPNNIIKKMNIGFHSRSLRRLIYDVQYLVKNNDIRQKMGEKAKAFSEKKFNVKRNVNKLESLLNKLICL